MFASDGGCARYQGAKSDCEKDGEDGERFGLHGDLEKIPNCRGLFVASTQTHGTFSRYSSRLCTEGDARRTAQKSAGTYRHGVKVCNFFS